VPLWNQSVTPARGEGFSEPEVLDRYMIA
jgi:hypothetical protein